MNVRKCLWFRFTSCPHIRASCTTCKYEWPTVEEFNKIYKNHQKMVQTINKFDKNTRKCNRKWKKWDDKRLEDLYRSKKNARHFQAD